MQAFTGQLCINALPTHVLEQVFLLLESNDRQNAMVVCRRWNEVFDNSAALLTDCHASNLHFDQCLKWVRHHRHSVRRLVFRQPVPNRQLLTMMGEVYSTLTVLKIAIQHSDLLHGLRGLSRLKELHIDIKIVVCINQVLEAVSVLEKLEKLVIESGRISQGNIAFPSSFLSLTRLTSLHMITTTNPLSDAWLELPNTMSQLSSLRELNLAVHVKSLPSTISHLSSLTALTVVNHLSKLQNSEYLGSLTRLRTLLLRHCDMEEDLPRFVSALQDLQDLTIIGCRLSTFPDGFTFPTKLKSLNLSRNFELQRLPSSGSLLADLQELVLESVDLREIPTSILELRSLRYLNLAYNLVSNLPGGAYLEQLTRLDLRGNKFQSMPAVLQSARNLEHLLIHDQRTKVICLSLQDVVMGLRFLPELKYICVVTQGLTLTLDAPLHSVYVTDDFKAAVDLLRSQGITVE